MSCSLRKIIVHLCREILNEERCPGFLLEAVRSAINKRRKLIKAKMLGIPVGECSSRSALHTLNTNLYIMSWYREVEGEEAFKKMCFFFFLPVTRRRRALSSDKQKLMVLKSMAPTNRPSHASETCEYNLVPRRFATVVNPVPLCKSLMISQLRFGLQGLYGFYYVKMQVKFAWLHGVTCTSDLIRTGVCH